jgi:hypothetical protein
MLGPEAVGATSTMILDDDAAGIVPMLQLQRVQDVVEGAYSSQSCSSNKGGNFAR